MGISKQNLSPFQRQLARARATDARLHTRYEGDNATASIKPGSSAGRALKQAERAVAAAAGAALVTAALVSPEETIGENATATFPNEPTSILCLAVPEAPPEVDAENERRTNSARPSVTKKWMEAGLGLVSMLVGALVQGLGFLVTVALQALFGGLGAGILGFLGDMLVGLILLFLIVSCLFRLLFPGRSLRELWTGKHLGILLAASMLYAVGRRIVLLSDDTAVKCILVCAETILELLLIGGTSALILKTGRKPGALIRGLQQSPVGKQMLWTLEIGVLLIAAFRMLMLFIPPAAVWGGAVGFAALEYLIYHNVKAASSAKAKKSRAQNEPFFPADAA